MTTARMAVMEAPLRMDIREVPLPAIGEDDGLLRVEGCGICGSDLELFEASIPGIPLPLVPGHETFGRIERLGRSAAKRWAVREGDRVVVGSALRCGRCDGCAHGRPCVQTRPGSRRSYGLMNPSVAPGLWGGYATHLYLDPTATLVPLAESLDTAAAAFHNPLANGIEWVCAAGRMQPDDVVLIAGAGPRGLACALAAKHFGAGHVTLTGLPSDRKRLLLAERLGVDEAIVVESDGAHELRDRLADRRPRLVVDTTPNSMSALAQLIEVLDADGTLVMAGIKGSASPPPVSVDDISLRRLTLTGPMSKSASSLTAAVELLNAEAISDLRDVPTLGYPLERAAEAVLALRDTDPDRPLQVRIEP